MMIKLNLYTGLPLIINTRFMKHATAKPLPTSGDLRIGSDIDMAEGVGFIVVETIEQIAAMVAGGAAAPQPAPMVGVTEYEFTWLRDKLRSWTSEEFETALEYAAKLAEHSSGMPTTAEYLFGAMHMASTIEEIIDILKSRQAVALKLPKPAGVR